MVSTPPIWFGLGPTDILMVASLIAFILFILLVVILYILQKKGWGPFGR